MKRNYPLFLIDRSKHASYPFDYITCFDKQVGFIAKVVFFEDETLYQEYVKHADEYPHTEVSSVRQKFKRGGVILQIEDFLYQIEWTDEEIKRIKTLLKKALKKYLHAEVDRTAKDGLGIDDQIKQQQLTIERARQQYDDLVKRSLGDKSIADYQIALAEATLETLKAWRDNHKLINLN